jgi:23S rRNA (guanine745-N1)-methyltransferase
MLGCENGHPFNIAKEGYVNLLLSHQRKSKHPGDDPDMVMARRRFFGRTEGGFFLRNRHFQEGGTGRL